MSRSIVACSFRIGTTMEMKGLAAGMAVERIVVVATPLQGEDPKAGDLVHSASR